MELCSQRLMAEFQEKLPETRFYIETGRYAVGTAGTYVAKVVDKKVTHGKNFVLLSATLNGFARPSMVAMLEHFMGNGPIAAWEPIYTGDHSFQMIPLVETAERETVTVTGNLCTGTDLVLSDADMPKMEVGDTVVFPNAGSPATTRLRSVRSQSFRFSRVKAAASGRRSTNTAEAAPRLRHSIPSWPVPAMIL